VETGFKILSDNRHAGHDYHLLERMEDVTVDFAIKPGSPSLVPRSKPARKCLQNSLRRESCPNRKTGGAVIGLRGRMMSRATRIFLRFDHRCYDSTVSRQRLKRPIEVGIRCCIGEASAAKSYRTIRVLLRERWLIHHPWDATSLVH
jgi:hypothetical protein